MTKEAAWRTLKGEGGRFQSSEFLHPAVPVPSSVKVCGFQAYPDLKGPGHGNILKPTQATCCPQAQELLCEEMF